MNSNTELIADLQSNIVGDPFPLMRKAADAIEALEATNSANMATCKGIIQGLEAEVERLTAFAGGYANENLHLQAQLAAAQGQSQQYDEALCTVAEQRDMMKLRIRQHLANRYAYTFKEFCEKLEEILYAAPIPQQVAEPSVPEGWKLVPEPPTEDMWGGLARDIVGWLYSAQSPHYGSKLHTHLRCLGRDIPTWLCKEIPDAGYTPAKGDFAVAIYKAMLEAAPQPKEPK